MVRTRHIARLTVTKIEARDRRKFIISEIDPHDLRPGEYLMMTIRSHDQFNTTIYGLNDRYRGVYNGRRVVFMNVEDVSEGSLSKDSSLT